VGYEFHTAMGFLNAVEVHASRLMTYHLAWLVDRGDQAITQSSIYRFVRMLRIMEGISEIQRLVIARSLGL
jgi:alkylation response protein AidB-like acyl-CoA dehydrogenase